MGQRHSSSSSLVLQAGIAAGILLVGYKLLARQYFSKEPVSSSSSPQRRGRKDSFVSTESVDGGTELDGEIERAAAFINNIKRLMEDELAVGEEESGGVSNRKRQLEQSLSRAENSFHSLFELKSQLKQFETNGILLESKVTTEVAKSAALRDIEERLLWSGFGPKDGDASPFKRQRTQTS